jgi:hypothetical protein
MLFGDDQSRDMLPSSWLTNDVADAVLVICAEESEFGSVVEVCDYEDTGGDIFTVTFHARQVSIRAYELRTGDLTADTSVEIRGECPFVLSYFGSPPSRRFVTSTESDVRAAYQRLVNP